MLIGGAAINRAFGYRALYPGGKESDEVYEPGVFYCKDAFEGLAVMDQLVDSDARGALVEKLLAGATEFRAKGDAPVEKVDLGDVKAAWEANSVILISDLETASSDTVALTQTLVSLRRAGVSIQAIPLFRSEQGLALFKSVLGAHALLPEPKWKPGKRCILTSAAPSKAAPAALLGLINYRSRVCSTQTRSAAYDPVS